MHGSLLSMQNTNSFYSCDQNYIFEVKYMWMRGKNKTSLDNCPLGSDLALKPKL